MEDIKYRGKIELLIELTRLEAAKQTSDPETHKQISNRIKVIRQQLEPQFLPDFANVEGIYIGVKFKGAIHFIKIGEVSIEPVLGDPDEPGDSL